MRAAFCSGSAFSTTSITRGWSQYDKEQFLATQFIQSDEFKALFGANPTNEEYIDAMYQNVLDRLPGPGWLRLLGWAAW